MWFNQIILSDRKTRVTLSFCFLALLGLTIFFIKPGSIFAPALIIEVTIKPDPWKEAAERVAEDRGEPTGRDARVEVPPELRHYSDRRRFLAVQSAECEEQKYEIPHDYAALIDLVRRGQLIEMEPLGADYILYGAGESATEDGMTHFDRATGEDIPLLERRDEYEAEYNRMVESIGEKKQTVIDLQLQLRRATKDRALRKTLSTQLADARLSLEKEIRRADTLAYFYKDPHRLRALIAEREFIYEFASHFGDKRYDLSNPSERRQFKIRLLSYLRPEARDLLMEIARGYNAQFARPLPVTSLVRSEQYQRLLGETNPNAARTAAPPHTTGLAFDIYYRYMTAAEQEWLMSEVARLKSRGRVEALRETRDHIHVFVFADSRPPDERLIRKMLGQKSGVRSQESEVRSQESGVRSQKSEAGRVEVSKTTS